METKQKANVANEKINVANEKINVASKTAKEPLTKKDLVGHINLLGNSILVCMECKVSQFELSSIENINANQTSNKSLQDALSKLESSPKKIVKLSKHITENLLEVIKIGDILIPSIHDTPMSLTNTEDPLDLTNVIEDFKFDNKNKGVNGLHNTIGTNYTIRVYRIYNANFGIATLSI